MVKIKFLNNFIKMIRSSKKQKALLKKINVGDLVWAKMPFNKKELSNIEKSHQIRPYLIVGKDFANIYGYPSSSKQTNNLNNYEEYFINKLRYKQHKDSWINLTKLFEIPVNNLKLKHITLNKLDLKNIQKRLSILAHRNNNTTHQIPIDIYVSEGDIIAVEHQLYYVYAADNSYLYCFTIFKKRPMDKKNYKNIVINNKTYYTTFKEKLSFVRATKMDIINIAYKNEIETILKMKSGIEFNFKKLTNNEKKTIEKVYETFYESGTVFKIGKYKIIYLFKYKKVHYGLDLLLYKINPKLIPIFDIEKRQILEILSLEDFLKIIEFLILKNIQPSREINNLYQEIREVIYN